jgi:hypothetical protein
MHGGASTGARSVDGKLRQAEGRERHIRRLRALGRKPGPPKGAGGRPRKTAVVDPAVQDCSGVGRVAQRSARRPRGSHEGVPSPWSISTQRPQCVCTQSLSLPAIASEPPELTLAHDANVLTRDVEAIGQLAMARIKETLAKPFDPADQNYVALLKFTASVYGSTMNTILRADENRLRRQAVDRLPELLSRVHDEERKRAARRTIEGTLHDA